jgi:phosphatidylglycerophosphatase C
VAGSRDLATAAAFTIPRFVAAALTDRARDAAKAALLRRVLAGRREAWLRELGARFADVVVSRRLRSGMPERLAWHRKEGHAIVIISASPTLYMDTLGDRLGVDAVLATELEVGDDGCLTGELLGANVRRAEKVRRLEAWLAGAAAEVWAYGDSAGDRELLERADHPMRI